MSRFDDRVAIVTGAGSGTGAAIATQLAEEGASVVCTDLDGADQTAALLGKRGRAVRLDVADAGSVARLARERGKGAKHAPWGTRSCCVRCVSAISRPSSTPTPRSPTAASSSPSASCRSRRSGARTPRRGLGAGCGHPAHLEPGRRHGRPHRILPAAGQLLGLLRALLPAVRPRARRPGVHDRGVRLLVDYLFGAKKDNRLSLVILPENAPSRRIADRCGFQLEGTARGALFHGGRSVDVLIYSLRDDPRPRPPA